MHIGHKSRHVQELIYIKTVDFPAAKVPSGELGGIGSNN